MLVGALTGAIVGALVWIIFAVMASGTSTAKALGPNPAIKESKEVSLDAQQVLDRLKAAGGSPYVVEPASTAEAIMLRRKTDAATMGYAFLIRTVPKEGGGSTLHLSVAPLSSIVKQVVPKHWQHYRTWLDQTLG